MTLYALLFTLSAIGISEAAYLVQTRRKSKKAVCPIGEDCNAVLKSKYNQMFFGIHNDIVGFLFYVLITIITAFLVIGVSPVWFWEWAAVITITGAVIMSTIFLFLQWKVIRAWCFWCILSAGTVFGMAGILFVHFIF